MNTQKIEIICDAETYLRFTHGELPFHELTGESGYDDVEVTEPFELTARDLMKGLQNLKEHPEDIWAEWFLPLLTTEPAKGKIRERIGTDKEDLIAAAESGWVRFPVTEAELICTVLAEISFEYDPDLCEEPEDITVIEEMIGKMETFFYNTGKRLADWDLNDEEMLDYLARFKEADGSEENFAEIKDALVLFTNKLIRSGQEEAIRLKAWSSYGGDRFFPCDWHTCRDLLLKLAHEYEDPYACNALGYIYYYGRCTEGKPDYENAFRYFSVGAVCGIFESMYKLGDLYRHGRFAVRSTEAARRLYESVYLYTIEDYVKGAYAGKFADAALRMSLTAETDELAYRFALEARTAIRRRLPYQHYGDESVSRRITERAEELKNRLSYGKECIVTNAPQAVLNLRPGNEYVMTFESREDDILCRIRARDTIIVTIEDFDYSDLRNEVILHVPKDQEELLPEEPVSFTGIGFTEMGMKFMSGEETVYISEEIVYELWKKDYVL